MFAGAKTHSASVAPGRALALMAPFPARFGAASNSASPNSTRSASGMGRSYDNPLGANAPATSAALNGKGCDEPYFSWV